MNVTLDTTKFNAALKAFRANSKRAVKDVLTEQARGIVKKVIDWTPPGGKGATGTAAKKRGESKVESDIRKLMESAPAKQASSESPASIHKANRTKTGRVRRELNPKIKVKAGDLKRYIAAKKKMVGFLASGWKDAANKLRIALPQWIRRHDAPGSGDIKATTTAVTVTITNKTKNAPALDMERRIQSAMDSQAAAMMRKVKFYGLTDAAKKAGFRT